MRVLIVDDTPFIRAYIGKIVDSCNLEIVGVAESGKDAIEKAKLLQPDLIIMDYVMPEMDGIRAMREIKHLGVKSQFIICATNIQHKVDALIQGAKGFIRKPISVHQAINEIYKVLNIEPTILFTKEATV